MTKWHPIETAPRMRPIIVWSSYNGMVMAYWSEWKGEWMVSCSGLGIIVLPWKPTHWTDLPSPPGD